MQLLRPLRPVSVTVTEGADRGTYTSRVLDFIEGEEILIGGLIERGREVRLEPGAGVQLQLTRPDGLHVLSTRVLERTPGQPSLRLAWPERMDHVQRRSHARVDVLVRSEVAPPSPEDGDAEALPALVSSLGTGGARVTLPAALEPDTQVRFILHLPGIGARTCEALVLRGGRHEGAAANHRYWAALEFVGMLESVREDLTSFVVGVQREALRRSAVPQSVP